MSQAPIAISTTPPLPGTQLVDEANAALEAIATDFAGPTDPAGDAVAYSTWADTGTGYMKRRNSANSAWDNIGRIVPTIQENASGELVFPDATVQSTAATNYLAWQAVKTAGFTAVAKEAYPINTTSAAITAILPATPTNGDYVELLDYAGTFQTNALTINPNGNKINGSTASVVVNTPRASLTLVYIDSTQGWLCFGGFKESPIGGYSANYLIVAGGGGGGFITGGGGGGGGVLAGSSTFTPGTAYTITVGNGGAGGTSSTGASGLDSSISGVATAIGGGGGGKGSSSTAAPLSGASGGGAGGDSAGSVIGASGTSGQGYAGGNNYFAAPGYGAGGGGGAGGAGANGSALLSGAGGAGFSSSISGAAVSYAGGGGGGGTTNGATAGAGNGGGGNGGALGASGSNASANTGGGGGGCSFTGAKGGDGGSGVVIISYAGAQRGTGGNVTTSGGYTIHTFTSSGTFNA